MWGQVGNTARASLRGTWNWGHPTFSELLQSHLSMNALPVSQGTHMQNGEEDAEKTALFGHEFERLSYKCSVKSPEIPGSRHESHITV